MTLKALVAGAAACAFATVATPFAAGAADLPSEAQNFVKVCKTQMQKSMAAQEAQLKKMGDDAYKKIMAATRGMCDCMATEIHKSDKISAEDKQKVWAVKDFSAASKPKMSKASEAGFRAVGQTCGRKMREVMMEVMRKARDNMKSNQ